MFSEDPTLAWNQLLSFEIEPQAIKELPNMTVNVELMDKAMIGSDSTLGTASFTLKDFVLGEEAKNIVCLISSSLDPISSLPIDTPNNCITCHQQ